MYAVLAVSALFVLVIAGALLVYYKRRAAVRTGKKTSALGELVNVDAAGQIIPEEGDPVEWGIGSNHFDFGSGGISREIRDTDDNLVHWLGDSQPRRRNHDLLAL